MSKKNENEKAGLIGIVGGILLLIAGVTGAAAWQSISDTIVSLTGIEILGLVFGILVILGSLGGLLVIAGGFLIRGNKKVGPGKTMVTIGAGFGLIGLIIFIILTVRNGQMPFLTGLSIGFIGLILTISARKKARK